MLFEKIIEDLKTAMKEKDQIRLATLRMVKSAMQNKVIEKKVKDLSDEDMLQLIQKQIKQRKDSIEQYEAGKRDDLVKKENSEIEVLKKYLPQQLSQEELKAIIAEAVAVTGAKLKQDMGKVMKEVIPKVKGRADGKEINQLVNDALS